MKIHSPENRQNSRTNDREKDERRDLYTVKVYFLRWWFSTTKVFNGQTIRVGIKYGDARFTTLKCLFFNIREGVFYAILSLPRN